METQHHQHPLARKRERSWHYLAAMVLSALLLSLGMSAASLAAGPFRIAQAMENAHGPGINWGNGIHMHGAGAFIVNGTSTYCAEPWIRSGTAIPVYIGVDKIPANSSDGVSVAATEGAPLREISFLLARYGQTNNDTQAAAVALAIWEIRGAAGRGNSEYEAELVRVRESVGSGVVSFAQRIRDEATNWITAIQSAPSSEHTPGITLDPASPYRGVVQVPPGTTNLQIRNGTFLDGTSARQWPAPGAPLGTSLSWLGQPSAEHWGKFYQVAFTGEYLEIPVSVMWGDGQGSQSSVSLVEPVVKPLRISTLDADTTWLPEVSSTVASKYVSVGDPHSDDVVFSSASSANALNSEWRWRRSSTGEIEWMPVTARVTAYGPYLSDPALNPSFSAPIGAPVAASALFTTDPARDQRVPQRYTFEFDQPILEQGYYTYKWDIDGNEQFLDEQEFSGCESFSGEPLCSALPTNYFFSDGFGTAGETQIGKSSPVFHTEISTRITELNGVLNDRVEIPHLPNWLRDDSGARIPLTLTGTAYLVPGPELTQSAAVPEGAIELETFLLTTQSELNEQTLDSPAVTIPIDTSSEFEYVTWRWCVIDEDQQEHARGFWEESCDDFGVPNESARIVHPEVRTTASANASPGTEIADTAIVNGAVPSDTELVFELFKQPEVNEQKQTPDPSDGPHLWSKSEVAALQRQPLCSPDNRVFVSEAVPVRPGNASDERYRSGAASAGTPGTYWWVESLIYRSPETGEATTIHRGDCGVPNETTSVALSAPPQQLANTGSAVVRVPNIWGVGLLVGGGVVWAIAHKLHTRTRQRLTQTDRLGGKQPRRRTFFPAHHLAKM